MKAPAWLLAPAFVAGGTLVLCLAMSGQAPAPAPLPDALPACATEDSTNCYWDAETMGNGEGLSFIDVDGETFYEEVEGPSAPEPEVTEPEPVAPVEPEVTAPKATEPEPEAWFQPCTDWLAEHGGICKGEPLTWGFSSGETLVCGHGAKPAIDKREDGIGYWAYCEPALVQP